MSVRLTAFFGGHCYAMKTNLGCALLFSLPAFIAGWFLTLAIPEIDLGGRTALAIVPGITIFLAAFLLITRDQLREQWAIRSVQKKLLPRPDVSDAEFAAAFSDVDPELLILTRQALAKVLDVPSAKIHPSDQPREDLRLDILEASLAFFVAPYVLRAVKVDFEKFPRTYSFDLHDLGDIARSIRRSLDEFEAGWNKGNDSEFDPPHGSFQND